MRAFHTDNPNCRIFFYRYKVAYAGIVHNNLETNAVNPAAANISTTSECYADFVWFAATGGLIYFQNAAPNGPAAYMLAESIDRVLRNVDDKWQMMTSRGFSSKCNVMDQVSMSVICRLSCDLYQSQCFYTLNHVLIMLIAVFNMFSSPCCYTKAQRVPTHQKQPEQEPPEH